MRIKSIITEKIITLRTAITITLFFSILFAPLLGSQAATGPIVNAILFLSVVFLGHRSAIWFSIIPSILALFFGIIPLPLAFFVPFIITGNIIMVTVFDYLKKNYWHGVFLAATAKFLFLFTSSYIITSLLLTGQLATRITTMFGWHQLGTSIVGGLIAYAVISMISRTTPSSL